MMSDVIVDTSFNDTFNSVSANKVHDDESNTKDSDLRKTSSPGRGTKHSNSGAPARLTKDPYRHILPHKMSFHTTGAVLTSIMRPRSGRRKGRNVSPTIVAPDVSPGSRRGMIAMKRERLPWEMENTENDFFKRSWEWEPTQEIQTTDGTDGNNVHANFKPGRQFQTLPTGENLKETPPIVMHNVNRLGADGFAPLHIAAQSNHLGWINELIQRNADVNISTIDVGFTPLHLACRFGCLEAVTVLLKYGARCDASTSLGQRPIHLASRRGHAGIIKVLLENNKYQVNVTDKDLMTPLHMAAINGDVSVCQLLIESGADICAREVSDMTPVMMACSVGQQEFIQCILLAAPRQNLRQCDLLSHRDNEGKTTLHIAINAGFGELVKFLLDKGVDVNAQKSTGQTPLHLAAIVGNVAIAKLLLGFKAAIDKGDNELMTPLHRSAMYNRPAVVKLLLQNGANINARGKANFTPLLCACWKGHVDMSLLLISQGADIELCDSELKTCIHWCVEMGHTTLLNVLFQEGALQMLEWMDRSDQTALHYAAEIGNVELVDLLLSKGAKGDVRDIDEKTPLHIASQCGRLSCVEILLRVLPNLLNEDDADGMTPLLLASQSGHVSVVRCLLCMGADISSKNDQWKSALALAVMKNHLHTVSVLIEHNADVNAIDKEKNTPLHLACEAGHYSITKLLLAAGAELTHRNSTGLYALDVAIDKQDTAITKAIVTSKRWESALNNRNEDGLTPMKKLIEKMPDAALVVLDHCVKRSHSDANHPDLEITYDFSCIDPGPENGNDIHSRNTFMRSKDRFFGPKTMAKYSREKLLSHELIENIISRKWSKFAGILYSVDFFMYLLLVACIAYYTSNGQIIASGMQFNGMGCLEVPVNDTRFVFNDEGVVIRLASSWLLFAQSFISLYSTVLLLFKLINLLQQRLSFFWCVSNYMSILVSISCLLFTVPPFYPPCALQWESGVFANFFVSINLMLYFQPIQFFGIYIGMFLTTLRSLLKAMTVYIFFILAFGMGFFICFARLDAFRDPINALVTTFVMTLGEINKADIFDSGISLAPFDTVGYILFVIFLFMMPMVLINLTIGISVGDIEAIYNHANLQRLQILVGLIWEYETKLPMYFQRKIHETKITVRPNRRRRGGWIKLWHFLSGGAYKTFVSKDSGSEVNETTIEDVVRELHQNRRMIAMLDNVLQQHTDTLKKISNKFDISNNLGDLSSLREMTDALYPGYKCP